MRAMGALVVTCLLAVGITALRRLWPNRATAFGAAAAVTPMVLFLASAVNPNGLEVASGFAFLSALLLLVGPEPMPRRWPWLVVVGVAGVLLAQARGISPLWMSVIVLIVIVMTPWPRIVASFCVRPRSPWSPLSPPAWPWVQAGPWRRGPLVEWANSRARPTPRGGHSSSC